jgi:hypothetical protein
MLVAGYRKKARRVREFRAPARQGNENAGAHFVKRRRRSQLPEFEWTIAAGTAGSADYLSSFRGGVSRPAPRRPEPC